MKEKTEYEKRERRESEAKFEIARAAEPVSTIAIKDSGGRLVEGYLGVFNEKQRRVVSVVREGYKLLPNKLILDPILSFLKKKGLRYVIDKFSYVTGARMRLHLSFPDLKIRDDTKEGIVSSVFVHNSYNMTEAFKMMGGAMRLVCANGMVIGTVVKKLKVIHQAEEIREIAVANLEALLSGMHDSAALIEARIKEMRAQRMTVESIVKISAHLDERTLAHLMVKTGLMTAEDKSSAASALLADLSERVRISESAWVVYNILTEYISHAIPQRYRMDYLQRLSRGFQL